MKTSEERNKRILYLTFCILILVVSSILNGCGSSDGSNGSAGADGTNGVDGADGSDSMPYVVYMSPAETEKGVKENSNILVVFNKAMDTATLAAGSTFRVLDTAYKDVSGTISWDTGNRALTFTPAELFNAGSKYSVRIDRSVTDSTANTLGYDFVTDFSVIGWGITERVVTDNTDAAAYPHFAFTSDGNGIAVWHESDGTRYNIRANHYISGAGWGLPELIEFDDTGSATKPQIVIDQDGVAVVIWHYYDGTNYTIRANRYQPGAGWGSVRTLSENSADHLTAEVDIDPDGNVTVVWPQNTGTKYAIHTKQLLSGHTYWEDTVVIDTGDSFDDSSPQIGNDNGGNAIAVWVHNNTDSGEDSVQSCRRHPGGEWGDIVTVYSSSEDALKPDIAVAENGNAVLVWYESSTPGSNIRGAVYVSGSGWGAAEIIDRVDYNAGRPQVAVDLNGNAIVVWRQTNGSRYSVWAGRYTNGTGWGEPELIETDETGSVDAPRIAFDPFGNAIAIWPQYRGFSLINIWANRYVVGSGWGDAQLIETNDAGSGNYPYLTFDSDGNGLAIWTQFDGTTYNIVSRCFN